MFLPDIEFLHIDILPVGTLEETNEFDLSPIQALPKLKHLWINGSTTQSINFILNAKPGVHSINITQLHFDLRLKNFNILHLLKVCPYLEVFDLRNTEFGSAMVSLRGITIAPLFKSLSDKPLAALSLRNIQRFGTHYYLSSWKLKSVFRIGNGTTLTYLDLSDNDLQYLDFDPFQFPNLAIMDLSQNMLMTSASFGSIGNTHSMLQIALLAHPSIQVVNVGGQTSRSACQGGDDVIENDVSDVSTYRENSALAVSKRIYKRSSPLSDVASHFNAYPQLKICLSQMHLNVSELLFNQPAFGRFVLCALGHGNGSLSEAQYVPPLFSLLDSDCAYSLRIPVAPNLHDVRMDHFKVNWIEQEDKIGKPFCFGNNSLYSLDISYNKVSQTALQTFMERIQGADHVKNIESKGIPFVLHNQSFQSFSNLESLSISHGKHTLSIHARICDTIPHISHLDISYSQIAHIPDDFFRGCAELTFLDLSRNYLSFLSEQVRSTLDAVANNHPLEIDLSENALSCRCHGESLNTIEWIHKSDIRFTNHGNYKCIGFEGLELVVDKNIDDYAKTCTKHEDNTWRTLAISLGASFAFQAVLLVFFLCHRYRFKIRTMLQRLWLYLNCALQDNYPSDADLYITINNSNPHMFLELMRMMQIFEDTHGLNCWCFERDGAGHGVWLDIVSRPIETCRAFLFIIGRSSQNPTDNNFQLVLSQVQHRQHHDKYPPKVFYILLHDAIEEDFESVIEIQTKSKHVYRWPSVHVGDRKSATSLANDIISEISYKVTMALMRRPNPTHVSSDTDDSNIMQGESETELQRFV